jgi:hypothetical protein
VARQLSFRSRLLQRLPRRSLYLAAIGQRGPVSSTRQRGPFRNIGPSSFTNPCPGPFVIQ